MFYLSHGWADKPRVRVWQLRFEKKFPNIKLYNPFFENPYSEKTNNIDVPTMGLEQMKDVVETDLEEISKSNRFVVVLPEKNYPLVGTSMEMRHAYLEKVPIDVIGDGKLKNHIWIVYHLTNIFPNFGEYEEFVQKELKL